MAAEGVERVVVAKLLLDDRTAKKHTMLGEPDDERRPQGTYPQPA